MQQNFFWGPDEEDYDEYGDYSSEAEMEKEDIEDNYYEDLDSDLDLDDDDEDDDDDDDDSLYEEDLDILEEDDEEPDEEQSEVRKDIWSNMDWDKD
jgi:DNA-directed RNA polymerase subunit delta